MELSELHQGILIGFGAAALLGFILYFVKSKPTGPAAEARQIGQRWLTDSAFAAKVNKILKPDPVKPSGEALRLLAVLQREGRLLDFLLEDIQNYADAQIGVAVRDIHRGCQKALKEHLVLEPILPGEESQTVSVPANFDPSAIRLLGNVTGNPPFRGALQHHGWRVKELKLAKPAEGQDEFVLAPAEVQLP